MVEGGGARRSTRLWASRATWRSGYAAACKAVYTGSIPVVASLCSGIGLGEPGEDVLARELEAERGQLGDHRVRQLPAVALCQGGRAGGVLDERPRELARRQARPTPREAGDRLVAAVGQRAAGAALLDPDVEAPPVGDADVADGGRGREGRVSHGGTQSREAKEKL